MGWVHSYGANEGLEMRIGLEEVAKVEDFNPVLETDIGYQQTEGARTEVVTCEGETVQCLGMITRMAHDSLDDFPRQ